MTVDDLLRHYKERRDEIQARLAEFPLVYKQGDLAIFKELCFCILTANTSAKMGITCIEAAGDGILTADLEGLQNTLCGRYRFWRVRPTYIIHTRDYLMKETGFGRYPLTPVSPLPPTPTPAFGGTLPRRWGGEKESGHIGDGNRLRAKIDSLTDFHERRDFFAANKGIKGIGYKEASHFLRNIGFSGYAILDKHIVNMLFELGVLPTNDKPANRKKYIEIEDRLRVFSNEIGIDMDEMDLALWSYKTGVILK
jgi:N-glycosylase/DNA lyase